MIKKFAQLLSKAVFIPKSETEEVEESPIIGEDTSNYDEWIEEELEEKPYIGIPAPVETPTDPWFTDVVTEEIKTEKQHTHEEMLGEAQRREEENRKKETKEPENIHQVMYEMATANWNTVAESQGGSENFQEGPGGWCSGTGYNQFRG